MKMLNKINGILATSKWECNKFAGIRRTTVFVRLCLGVIWYLTTFERSQIYIFSRSSVAWATNKMYTFLEIQNCKWFFMLCAPLLLLLLLLLSSFRFCVPCNSVGGRCNFQAFSHDTRRQCLTSKMHSTFSLESSVVQAKCQPAFRWILKVSCVVSSALSVFIFQH